MKNIRLLIFLLLNINLLLSSDDLSNKPYYFNDNKFKKYIFKFESDNKQEYGILLLSEIEPKGCELLKARLMNLQTMVQAQQSFLEYWGEVSKCLDQTKSNDLKLFNNEKHNELTNFLALVDMYFNTSTSSNIFRLKNKFNEFESILKSDVKSNEYDKYMPKMQFKSIIGVKKNEIDVDNEKSASDLLNHEPEGCKKYMSNLLKVDEEKGSLNYSDIKKNYYNNCDTFVKQYLQKKFLLDSLYKKKEEEVKEEKVQEVKVQNIPKKFLTIKRALIILGYIVVIGIIAYLVKKFIIDIDESSRIKNAYKL